MIIESLSKLKSYCEKEQFKGWDPYDGLNSKVFQSLPFIKDSSLCRMIMIQGFKRCPINFRRIAMVPKGYNSKGIALFLQGYCNLYKVVSVNPDMEKALGSRNELLDRINELASLLLTLQSHGYSGACWGYDFDWQSKAFYLPKNTPTVVATSFAVQALLSAYEITQSGIYLKTALSSAEFILNDLNRIDKAVGYMFSYSPLDSRAVYNATLLGTKMLSLIYRYTGKEEYKVAAKASAMAVCNEQNNDGSFPHSDQVGNKWRDSFHTGFKLESLAAYRLYCSDDTFDEYIERGYRYWIDHYFVMETGVAKYYDDSTEDDVIDLHCAAQAIPTICMLGKFQEEKVLAGKILEWAIKNMQSEHGYFYFQKKKNRVNKIFYSRWPNAWMFYGISHYLLNENIYD